MMRGFSAKATFTEQARKFFEDVDGSKFILALVNAQDNDIEEFEFEGYKISRKRITVIQE